MRHYWHEEKSTEKLTNEKAKKKLSHLFSLPWHWKMFERAFFFSLATYTLFALICPKFMDSLYLRFRPYLPMFCFFFSIQNKYGCGWAGKPSDGLKIYWNSRIPQPVSTQPRTAYSTVSSTRVEATTPVLGWRQCGMAKQIILHNKKKRIQLKDPLFLQQCQPTHRISNSECSMATLKTR